MRRSRPPRVDPVTPDELVTLGAKVAAHPHARRGVAMSSEIIRVVLVDDHAMVREGLRLVLRNAADISVIGEGENGTAAVELARRETPDVVVLDLDMPGGGGEAALVELLHIVPTARVLILTVHAEQERLLALLESGARGYLTKEAASRDLIEAVRVVAAGEIYVRPAAARLLAAALVQHPAAAPTAYDQFGTLSEREQNVLRFVAQGFSGAEIARKLSISSKTVDAYKHRVRDKLGLEHRTDYVRFAIDAGILTPAPDDQ
jgi:two-component system response regulator NreC